MDDFEYHMETFLECDPDYICDVLGITSEELVEAFYDRAIQHIKEEHE